MSIGLVAGLRALLVSRRVMDVIGHNLANQNTPGYSRQVALLGTAFPTAGPGLIQLGTGVEIFGIRSIVNESLLSRIRAQTELDGRFTAEASLLADLEAQSGDLGAGSLTARLQAFFDGAAKAGSSPGDSALRLAFASAARDLGNAFRQRRGDLLAQRAAAISQARTAVESANPLLAGIAELNGRIANQVSLGQPANDLIDQRSELAREAARLVGATATQLQDGTLQVSAGGVTLVTGTFSHRLVANADVRDGVRISLAKGGKTLVPENGELGGLIGFVRDFVPARIAELDRLANQFALEANRVHSTGVPAGGPFTGLVGSSRIDPGGGVDPSIVVLSDAGLPFELKAGRIKFAVTDFATGDVRHHDVQIDPRTMSITQVVEKIRQIPGITASFEAGRLRIDALTGYGFDFSRRIDADPVEGGTFGARNAVLLAGAAFPVALTNGSQLTVSVDGGAPQTVTFNSADFADISNATAAEVAAVLNTQVSGASAAVVDGRLVLTSGSEGAGSSLAVADGTGSPAAALGLPFAVVTGSDAAVEVRASGAGSDEVDHVYTFEPLGDGQIGVTPDLKMRVRDENGNVVATLDVGAGYEPGSSVEFATGLSISFGAGSVSATANQSFALEVPGDTDTADFLPAFGLNSLFLGRDARTIEIDPAFLANPSRIAGGLGGGDGDGANFDRIAELADIAFAGLSDQTAGAFAGGIAGAIGNSAAAARTSLETVATALLVLEDTRQSESGVNTDEELLDLQRFEQMYQAAAKYLGVLRSIDQELFNVIR